MTIVKFNNKPNNGFNLLDNFFNEFPTLFKDDFGANFKNFAPVNIKETKNAYELEVVAPGFEKNDFNINLEINILTISAEKKSDTRKEDEKQIRNEYSYRSFKRSFTLDEKIDSEKVEAKYVNGVLTLNLPREVEVKASAKEISVQ
ncbi:MAG: Hsp20/alpha crystallin family protein [Bacteroidetes bacterium]|nr:MAG: Hsp20/alpha crystallin family protein [Bacteroidota bacterium]